MADNEAFAPFAERMRAEGLPEIVVDTFEHYYAGLRRGETGLIPEEEIEAVTAFPDVEALPEELAAAGEAALDSTVLMKLNGGLGTSMGLARAKSLLEVKEGLSFLDIIARQALQSGVPLVLMNSFNTRADSLEALEKYPELWGDIPLDFVQHKVPKIVQEDYSPAVWEANPELEWCPPGHGDIYAALVTSGMLDRLLEAGYEYAFISNSDNLGAVLDRKILGYFVREAFPFMMEVAERSPADRKGGHLARLPSGRLILRESAQCPAEDRDAFQDITRHKYFNTNNLWLHLARLKEVMEREGNILGLPMIRNEKPVDPRDATSTPVYQLETAMGSAIAVFEGAGAVHVPRSRLVPVKTTNDLLAVRSDAYVLTGDYRVIRNPERTADDLVVDLDRAYYTLVEEMEARFPYGAPSLLACELLQVEGDICFGCDVMVRGRVHLLNQSAEQATVEDGAVLTGEQRF